MCRIVAGFLILLLALPVLGDQDKTKDKPKTPQEQYKALLKEQTDARMAFQKAYQEAKTQEEKNKVVQEKYPNPEKVAPKFLELAEKNPKAPVAVDALVWVVSNTFGGGTGSPRAKAVALLLRDHVRSDKLGRVCQSLANGEDKKEQDLLRSILDKNPSKEVQGVACLALAQSLKSRADGLPESQADEAKKLRRQSEELFERATNKYADVKVFRSTVGDQAKSALFEMRYLSIGKEAPEIEGEDADSKKFKLSDYRGKVVLLDFWGHW